MRGGAKMLVYTCMQSKRGKTLDMTRRNSSSQVAFSASSSDGDVCDSHCSYASPRRLKMHVGVGVRKESDTWKTLQLKSSQEPMFADRQSPYSHSMGHNLEKAEIWWNVCCHRLSSLTRWKKTCCIFAVSKQWAKSAQRREELSWTLDSQQKEAQAWRFA